MYAISIDNAEKSNGLIKKIESDGNGKVLFPFLSDPDHKTIDAYGLFDTRYVGKGTEGIPQPAVFILDKDRNVFWANVESNYTMRPSLTDLRTQIDLLKKQMAMGKRNKQ